jgi:hypothetical protein
MILSAAPSPEVCDRRIIEMLMLLAAFSPEVCDRRIIEKSGLFDADWYQARYPDVEGLDPLEHYLAHGWVEGRSPGPDFDGAWYLAAYPDVANAGLNPLVHYLRYGVREGRSRRSELSQGELIEKSGLFDADWYRARYPDVEGLDPLEHYLAHGGVEGRSPGPDFDGAWYLAAYPDVANAGVNPLVHYLRYGISEGRSRRSELSQGEIELISKSLQEFRMFDPISLSQSFPDIQSLPMERMSSLIGITEVWDRLFARLEGPYDVLVFVPGLKQRGIEKWAGVNAAAEIKYTLLSKVAVIATDILGPTTVYSFPEDLKVLSLSEDGRHIAVGDRVTLLETLIYSVSPKSVLNVNSNVCWEAYRRRGRSLTQVSALYAALPLCGRGEWEELVCLAPSLRECLPFLQKLYFNDAMLMNQLIEWAKLPDYLLPRLAPLSESFNTLNAGHVK